MIGFHLATSQTGNSPPHRGLAIPAALRTGTERPVHTLVRELSEVSFAAEAISRLRPGTRCWLSLPGLAAKQAEVIDWHGSVVTCRFTENLSPLILAAVVEQPAS